MADEVLILKPDPEQLREDLERIIELESAELRGDPDRETKAWSEKLAEADRMRSGYQDLAARGLMSYEELGEKLEQLGKAPETAERELERLYDRRQPLEDLRRDKEAVLDTYAKIAPEASDALSAEERHRLYNMLRLRVVINSDRSVEVHGALRIEFVQSETLSR